ncbi:MAG: hypothetical protein H0T47_18555 [Planctomycetaceae bacterium]|nr:hypothetical protein [Planctomycetaceae bacterium]
MTKTLHGTIRGRTIELTDDPGLRDGSSVEIVLRYSTPDPAFCPGDGILRSAGALADVWTDEDDRILQEIYEDRHRPSHRELPE